MVVDVLVVKFFLYHLFVSSFYKSVRNERKSRLSFFIHCSIGRLCRRLAISPTALNEQAKLRLSSHYSEATPDELAFPLLCHYTLLARPLLLSNGMSGSSGAIG